MQKPDDQSMPRYFFSLPRLIARLRGHNAERTDTHWLEANAVGTLIHAIVFLFLARWLLTGSSTWQQLALLVPLAILTLLFWMLLFAVQVLVIKAARAFGMLRNVPDDRANGMLVGIVTTVFACQLLGAGTWLRAIAAVWLVALALNLLAACVLGLSNADASRAA
jgi:hypothetical protein